MNDTIICYGGSTGYDWAQEIYETSSRHAGRRARLLRKAGFRVISCSLGDQVTSVGRIKMTMLDIHGDIRNLPPVSRHRL